MLFYTFLWLLSVTFDNSKAENSGNGTSGYLIPCNPGWFLYDDKCYSILGDMKQLSWRQASEKCAAENGSLATISSAKLQDFLVMFLLFRLQKNAWIGLHDRVQESQFTWDDGSPLNYTNWDKYQPSGSGESRQKEDCVEMRYSNTRYGIGTWNDLSCETKQHFFCQANKSEDVLSRDPRFCTIEEGEGWKYLNSCYHIVTEAKTWEDAESYCKDIYSGHLVTILNEQTEMFLNYLTSDYDENFWIGIKMRDQELQMWNSGLPVIFDKCSLEEKYSMPGTCAMITGRKLWELGPCESTLPFICEKSDNSALILKKAPEGWQCPSDEWKDTGGEYCYIFETKTTASWNVANYNCVRKGGTLASIHSEAESYVLRHFIINAENQVFIGLHRCYSNKFVFEWVDGSPFGYTNWNIGEPNNKIEECVEVCSDGMTWNDVLCDAPRGYICSAKKVPPPFPPKINESVPSECVCTSSSNITHHEANSFKSSSTDNVCSSGMTSNPVAGIVVCILLIMFLTGVVIYQSRQLFHKILLNRFIYKDSSHFSFKRFSSEVVLRPEEES